MGRMIDADALEVVTAKVPKGMDAKSYMAGMEYVLSQIDALPTIEERKTGKWEQVEVNYLADMDGDIKESMAIASMFCPKCKRYHNEIYLYGSVTFGVNYCPNCGAKMEGEEDG